jgi:hypothetical protein
MGPLSLVITTEELLGRKISGCGLEHRDYGCVDSLCWPRDTFYLQKLAVTSPTSGRRSFSIVHSRTKATEVSLLLLLLLLLLDSEYFRRICNLIYTTLLCHAHVWTYQGRLCITSCNILNWRFKGTYEYFEISDKNLMPIATVRVSSYKVRTSAEVICNCILN